MGKKILIKAEINGGYFLKNALIMLKKIGSKFTIFFTEEGFYIQEITKNKSLKVIILVKNLYMIEYEHPNLEMNEIFCGFECDDFINKIGKISKRSVTVFQMYNKTKNEKHCIEIYDKLNPNKKHITSEINNISDDDEDYVHQFRNPYGEPNMAVSIVEFADCFIDIKQCDCDNVRITVFKNRMIVKGIIGKKKQFRRKFGCKKKTFVMPGEISIYPMDFELDKNSIEIFSKLKSLVGQNYLKFYFLETKIVIRSKLFIIGNVIFEIATRI